MCRSRKSGRTPSSSPPSRLSWTPTVINFFEGDTEQEVFVAAQHLFNVYLIRKGYKAAGFTALTYRPS